VQLANSAPDAKAAVMTMPKVTKKYSKQELAKIANSMRLTPKKYNMFKQGK
jgi:hypothetical protein